MNEWSSWVIWSQLGIWAGLKLPEIGDRSLRWHSLCSKILTSAPWRIFSGHSINWTRRLIPSWCWGSRSSPGAAPPASAGPDQGTWKTQRVSSYTNSHKFRPQRILPFWAGSNTTDIVQQHVVVSEGNSTFWHPSTSIISHSEMPQLTLHMICSCWVVFWFGSLARRDPRLESLLSGTDSLSGWESTGRLRAWELCSRADIRVRTGCSVESASTQKCKNASFNSRSQNHGHKNTSGAAKFRCNTNWD